KNVAYFTCFPYFLWASTGSRISCQSSTIRGGIQPMGAEIQYKSPFNFVQVLILALGAAYLNVIVFFVSESAGGSMVFNGGLVDHVQFAQVLGFTLAPIMILGLLTFAVGSAKPGFCRIAQWLGA